jgi:hypothetical protein
MFDSTAAAPSVALLTNCYEATYRNVLTHEYWTRVLDQQRRQVDKRIAIINNVDDRSQVERSAQQLVREGAIDEYYFVADHIERALVTAGLTRAALGRIPYFSDFALVAVQVCPTDYMVCWDSEVRLLAAHDWITPSIARLQREPRPLVANPLWCPERNALEKIRSENFAEDEDFFEGYGFSDQVFLARPADLRGPIYDYFHPMSLRYTVSHIARIFEQRVDSYMRRAARTRLTYKHAGYSHPKETEGAKYPDLTLGERTRKHLHRTFIKAYKRVTGQR